MYNEVYLAKIVSLQYIKYAILCKKMQTLFNKVITLIALKPTINTNIA